ISTHAEIFKSQYRVIGEGCFGCVKLAYHRLTGTPVAVKVQQKGRRDPVIASEISIMKTLYHPNIIRLFQVMETVDHVYLVMEHVNGQQLQQHIIEAQRLCEEEARGIFKQLVCAVKYCHDGGIVHRDLKADNILLDAQGKAKVTDFGLGTRYSFGQSLTDWCGAFRYWALELFLRLPYDGRKVDVWSLGIVLYYMVTGALPFTGETVLQVRWAVLKLRYDIPRYLSMGLRNIIVQMLTKNPSERPSLDHIVGHPWLRQGEEGSPSPAVETLPKRLDPAILAAMCDLGYYPGDIYQSLLQRKFDEAMATYLLLREQVCQRIRFNACIKPPVCPEIVPTPSRRPFHLRSSTKEESQCTCPSSNFTLSSEDEKAGHRGRRRSSMPNIAISILPRRIPTTGVIPQPGPEAVTPPRNVESGMFCEGMSSKEHAFTGGQPHDGVATSISDNIPDWKRVRRRIVNAILSLCCCVWGQNSQPQFHNTVAPNKSTDS
uniref:non-specific serine/threonine protein kinase n=1 Tax=Castor canadensis TaxID=51338 RepID=A0A8C0WET8_CASCN